MNNQNTDYYKYCSETGDYYAGSHLLIDFWGMKYFDIDYIQKSIEEAAIKAKATVLYSYYHPFGNDYGMSGVTVLAESHISIHTWPEKEFAAIDIFMCGDCDPEVALSHLVEKFNPSRVEKNMQRRGIESAQRRMAA